jgi:hypothetical protein
LISLSYLDIYGKATSRCHLGMLKVNSLKHTYLNIMKLENAVPSGGMFKPHKFLQNTFQNTSTRMVDAILESSLKTTLLFLLPN